MSSFLTVMGILWGELAELLFPPRCPYCAEVVERGTEVCAACRPQAAGVLLTGEQRRLSPADRSCCKGLDAIAATMRYTGPGAAAIVQLKSNPRFTAAGYFAGRLAEALIDTGLADADAITFVPPHWTKSDRYLAEHLARLLSKRLGIPVVKALRKCRATKSQHRLTRRERAANLRGAFIVTKAAGQLDGRRVILVDDVITSGATLSECAATLKAAGVSWVTAACLAATPDKKSRWVKPPA